MSAALGAGDVDPAARLLARAFFADPLAAYVFPDETTRLDALAHSFAWRVRYGRSYGHALRPAATLSAVALILPPDPEHYSAARLSDSGYEGVAAALGRAEAHRIATTAAAVVGYCEGAAEQAGEATDWQLHLIGVDPEAQHTGVGGRLMAAINRRADDAGAGMRLLTFLEANLGFYARHGYAVVVNGREPGSGLEFWVLRRQARVHNAPEL